MKGGSREKQRYKQNEITREGKKKNDRYDLKVTKKHANGNKMIMQSGSD